MKIRQSHNSPALQLCQHRVAQGTKEGNGGNCLDPGIFSLWSFIVYQHLTFHIFLDTRWGQIKDEVQSKVNTAVQNVFSWVGFQAEEHTVKIYWGSEVVLYTISLPKGQMKFPVFQTTSVIWGIIMNRLSCFSIQMHVREQILTTKKEFDYRN